MTIYEPPKGVPMFPRMDYGVDMPDTILFWNASQGKRVPSWYPHGLGKEDSFTDEYMRRLEEFRTMSREDLKTEVARLRTQVKQDGRRYIAVHHAQRFAAEDTYASLYANRPYDV